MAAIAYAHDLAGLASPVAAKAVRVVLSGIRRAKGSKPTQKAPANAERIAAMLEAIPATLRGTRDRELLTLGFAGAFRRSELVELKRALPHAEDIRALSTQDPPDEAAAKSGSAHDLLDSDPVLGQTEYGGVIFLSAEISFVLDPLGCGEQAGLVVAMPITERI